MKVPPVELSVKTDEGEFLARYSENGLVELDFPNQNRRRRGDESQTQDSVRDSSRRLLQVKIRSWHRLTAAALKGALAGRVVKKLPPLDWSGKNFKNASGVRY